MIINKETDGEYIRIDEETGEIIPKEGFVVDTKEKAEWVVGQLAAYATAAKAAMHTEEAQQAELVLAVARKNAEDWQAKYDRMLEFFRPSLMQVAKANAEKGEKFLRTKFGRIQVRSTPHKLMVVDESAVMAWAKTEAKVSLRAEVDLKDVDDIIATLLSTTDCVRMKFMPSLCPINADEIARGKTPTPPGMRYIPSHETAYVQFGPEPAKKKGDESNG